MRRKYKFLRNKFRIRRRYKEYPNGEVSNSYLLDMIKEDIRKGRDFIPSL